MARVVARAFDAGKLGTRAQVQRKLPGDRIFNAAGRMLSYAEMPRDTRVHFNEWVNNDPRVRNVTGRAQFAARQRVRANPPSKCS